MNVFVNSSVHVIPLSLPRSMQCRAVCILTVLYRIFIYFFYFFAFLSSIWKLIFRHWKPGSTLMPATFVVTDSTGCCRNDNLLCHQRRQSWHHCKSRISISPYTNTCSQYIMTSSNENIFRVTDPLWEEPTGHRWIPFTKVSATELSCFLWPTPEQTIDQTIEKPVIWDAIAVIMTSL